MKIEIPDTNKLTDLDMSLLRVLTGQAVASNPLPVETSSPEAKVEVPLEPKAETVVPPPSTEAAVPPPPAEVVVPMPPPPPPAEVVEAAPPAPPATEGADRPTTVDSKGLPWDARIHSREKSLLTDGSWRYRRGVDPDEIKRVEHELKQRSVSPVTGESLDPVREVSNLIGRGMKEGKITFTQLSEILSQHGVRAVPDLRREEHAEACTFILAALKAAIGE